MHDDDEDRISLKPKLFDPKTLEGLSVEDMLRYIDLLEGEIRRVRETITSRKAMRAGAESVFRI